MHPEARAIDFTAVPVAITIMQGMLPAMEDPIDTRVNLEEHEAACQSISGFLEAPVV